MYFESFISMLWLANNSLKLITNTSTNNSGSNSVNTTSYEIRITNVF